MKVKLPYGKSYIEAEFQYSDQVRILEGKQDKIKADKNKVRESLEAPYGGIRLSELAKGKNKVTLILSDHTRPVPSKIIIPLMLKEIRKGNRNADITLLVATGCHRRTTEEELIKKLGSEIVSNEKIVVHDCDDTDNMKNLGMLPSGGILEINRIAADSDLLVSEGFIEPHFFAGFSGGRKSVLPGIASRDSIKYNHNSGFIDNSNSRIGNTDHNPIHADMIFAAKKAGLAFLVNVALNSNGEVIGSFAGEPEKAFEAGVDFVTKATRVAGEKADIVISTNNGYPLDQNVYQMVKCLATAEPFTKKNGVIIAVGECSDGLGAETFFETFANDTPIRDIYNNFLNTPKNKTIQDQWQSHIFARVLLNYSVILVSNVSEDLVRAMRMIPANSVEEAVEKAKGIIHKEKASINVIPNGVGVIPTVK